MSESRIGKEGKADRTRRRDKRMTVKRSLVNEYSGQEFVVHPFKYHCLRKAKPIKSIRKHLSYVDFKAASIFGKFPHK